MAAALTQQQIRALVDSVYAVSGHSHVIADTAGLQSGLDAKFNASGGTVTGAILTPDGSAAAVAIGFSGQPGTGMWRDTNGLQFSHAAVHSFEVRSSGIFFRQNAQPATDNARTMGSFNLRFARMHATHYRATLGAGNGFLFDDGSGNLVNSGVYAVGSTTLGFNLAGVAQATFTNTGFSLLTGVFRSPPYTVGTMPSAAANAGGQITVNNTPARSDGTNWRYVTDNSIVV